MSDSKNGAAEAMPAGIKNIIIINHEYKKIICRGKGCGRAIKADNLKKHLQGRHGIRISVAREASQVARGLKWDEELWRNVQPEDGLAPQVGVAVKDAFRCRHCHGYMSESEEDVEDHCNIYHRGVAEGSVAEHIRYQSWYGYYNVGYWIVDEDKIGEVRGDLGAYSGEGTGASMEERFEGDWDWEIV
ncbi:hypothetical protein V501_00092 [Pseudogymnoascus sp. VKM F-4519 (FW-2642)]|nr:hypothetical protein V501_00092 [Pseudogymnoascus sp. VKM F-4519 (FW-2642)]